MVEPDRAKGGHGAHSLLRTSMSGIWASCLFTFSFPFLKGLFFNQETFGDQSLRLGPFKCSLPPLCWNEAVCGNCASVESKSGHVDT